jgi:hypothetical protein
VAEWLSRQPRDLYRRGLRPKGKKAGGLRARRGSNPFPGAKDILLEKLGFIMNYRAAIEQKVGFEFLSKMHWM